MPSKTLFVDPADPNPADSADARRAALLDHALPAGLGRHAHGAAYYEPDAPLIDAINVALTVGAPLLLTGEPGTGKTQVAYYLARHFGIDFTSDAFQAFPVRSTTAATELKYRYDAIGYLRSAHDTRTDQVKTAADFVEPGPLWHAFEQDLAVLLIDEIDKAPRDFPNDLLDTLDQHTFTVVETGELRSNRGRPPIVVITSNSERRLPKPFLRRCIFHHIDLTDELIDRAVRRHAGDFPRLSQPALAAAVDKFRQLRAIDTLQKRPATAELLLWLAVLSARDAQPADLDKPLAALPALGALVKDSDDLDLLRKRRY
jgi:YD repeat-containing protein